MEEFILCPADQTEKFVLPPQGQMAAIGTLVAVISRCSYFFWPERIHLITSYFDERVAEACDVTKPVFFAR
jgi:hypothetical protein